jgi:zinc protease
MGELGLVAGTFEVRGPSMLQITVFYPGKPDVERVIEPIDEEFARLADGVDEDELARFRNAYLADLLGALDNLSNRGMLIAALEQQRHRAEIINEIPAAIERVRPEQVARIAAEWLRPERRAVVDLHPGAAS